MEVASPPAGPVRSGSGTLARVHRLIRSNWISSLGAAIATLAVAAELTFLFLEGQESWGGPYIGILTVLALPVLFLFGLLLIPFGLLLYRKQLAERIAAMQDRPMRTARAVVVITLVNLVAVGTAGTASVKYMNSTQFCGEACHKVMQPELDTYLLSPHSEIGCVTCHVGPGAQGFIQAKLNGTRQLVSTILDDYNRPVPVPVHDLPATKDVCEKCHSPRRFLGTKLLVKSHFEANEKNTGFTNVLLMRRGGEAPDGTVAGIHWHSHPDARVDYFAADEKRTSIPWMRVTKPDGKVKVFRSADFTGEPTAEQIRRMDCVDCHNRVGHPFDNLSDGIDQAMADGLVSRSLPFLKKHALEVLQKSWARETAKEAIGKELAAKYPSLDAKGQEQLRKSSDALAQLWLRNNYPDRKLGWNSYPSFKSHDGCFRCHDGKHRDESGAALPNACAICHVVLSEKQEDPAILGTLGIQGR